MPRGHNTASASQKRGDHAPSQYTGQGEKHQAQTPEALSTAVAYKHKHPPKQEFERRPPQKRSPGEKHCRRIKTAQRGRWKQAMKFSFCAGKIARKIQQQTIQQRIEQKNAVYVNDHSNSPEE